MLKNLLKKIVIFILTLEARAVLFKYKPGIVAVTGSVGKTATKDAICAVLEGKFFARGSEKSFNSEIGIPLAILGLKRSGWDNPFAWLHFFLEGLALIFLKNHYPLWLVLEVGTDRPGDIGRVARWLSPDIVVVTRLGEVPVHVEFFRSREELIKEKMNLVYALKDGGALVLNADDSDVSTIRGKTKQTVLTFGIESDAAFHATHAQIFYEKDGTPAGVMAKVEHKGSISPLKIYGTIGIQYISVALAAMGVGSFLKMNIVEILERFNYFKIPPGRLTLLSGKNESIIIDDSYNSSPVAAEAALRSFSELKISGRKIAVLGDMLELGKWSTDEHKKIGAFASHVAQILVTVGPRAKIMDESAYEEGMKVENVHHFSSSSDAGKFLQTFIQKGDAILVKGSQGMRMEKAVEQILAEPEKKKELLVRQEEEWLTR